MKILAFDAGLGPFSAALDLDGAVTSDRSDRNDALEAGLLRIAALLERAGVELAELDRIAVGIGPGSFTGIRIALSFAKALAYGAKLPLVGLSSYDILMPADLAGPCLSVVSGRPGVICARLLCRAASSVACGHVDNVLARLLSGVPSDMQITLVANTEDVVAEIGERLPNVRRQRSPAAQNAAAALARLARDAQPALSLHSLAPDYGEMPAVTGPKAGTEIAP